MSIGHGMIWPLAAEYARRGWAVRRVNWADEVTNKSGNHPQPSSLRWIVHHSGLFHLTYLNRGDDFIVGPVSRVVRNTDFGVDEFHADDWTVFSPGCSATPAPDQQGKLYYPSAVDDEPYDDPTAPGTGDQSCPDVPPIFDDPPPGDGDGDDGGGDGGGNNGGGGSGGGGGGGPRPPKPPPNLDPAEIIIENVTWTPDCFPDGTAPPFQIQLGFRVRLGAAPTPFANGLYWISVYVHGKKIAAPSWTPGTAVDYSVAVRQDLGKPVLIRANAYLPIRKIQSNARHEFNFPKICGSGCTNPHAANYDPEITDDDGSCITCASAGNCIPYDTDEGQNCNDVGNGCCDGYCETAGDCSPSFRRSFTAENGTYYPSCFG